MMFGGRPYHKLRPSWRQVPCCVAVAPCWLTLDAIRGTIATVRSTHRAVSAVKMRVRLRTRRVPKSSPVARPKAETTETETAVSANKATTPTSFLDLPVDLRLQIYQLAVDSDATMVQPGLYGSEWGLPPTSWQRGQHICADTDPPSKGLRFSIGCGASWDNQTPTPRRPRNYGCVFIGHKPFLICSDVQPISWSYRGYGQMREYMNLMRSCRIVYAEMLDVLYAHTTLCLFGPEMIRFFTRNASPEGLCRVQYCHIVLPMESEKWQLPAQKRSVEKAVSTLRDSLPSLRQLHMEVTLTWDQPANPHDLWMWLRDTLSVFRDLDAFVLKISVYARPSGDGYRNPSCTWEALRSWDDAEYAALKELVTRKGSDFGHP